MEKEITRIMGMLRTLDPTTEAYTTALNNMDHLYGLKREVDRWTGNQAEVNWEEAADVTEPVKAEPIKEVEFEEVKLDPEVVVETYTKEYVRDLLLKARDKGAKVEPIVEKFTPEGKAAKFSSIPATSYPELVKELEQYA